MSTKSKQLDSHLLDVTIGPSGTTVAHNLGRTPKDAIVLVNTGNSEVFRASTTWDSSNIYLQVDVVARTVRLLIF